MNREVVKALTARAEAIASGYAHLFGYYWTDYGVVKPGLNYDIIADGEIRFYRKDHKKHESWITFKGISPSKITNTIYHEPVKLNEKRTDVNASNVHNNSENVTITRAYSYTESDTTTIQEEAGVSVGIQIRQLIGYGGELAQVNGETEITASINAHYAKTWGTENAQTREVSNEVEVPPKTEVNIVTEKSVADFTQKCEYFCDLDHSINIGSVNEWQHNYDNCYDMVKTIKGYGLSSHPATPRFKKWPFYWYHAEQLLKPVDVRLETEVKFKNASTGNVKVSERRL